MSHEPEANIYTHYLSQFGGNHAFSSFVAYWDRLERFVLTIYRVGNASAQYEEEWGVLRDRLLVEYTRWQPLLAQFWPDTLVGGQPAASDPLAHLLATRRAADFVGKWESLQQLPAARESINRYLQSLS